MLHSHIKQCNYAWPRVCTSQGVVKRDHTLFQVMKHYNIPTAFLIGGGYQVLSSLVLKVQLMYFHVYVCSSIANSDFHLPHDHLIEQSV